MAKTDTVIIEFKRGISTVKYNGKSLDMKTTWLKHLRVNDLYETLKTKLK